MENLGPHGVATPVRADAGPEPDPDRVLRLALGLGAEMFAAGSETRMIELALASVARRMGVQDLQIDIAARSIHLQHAPSGDRPLLMMRVSRTDDGRDLERMSAVHRVVDRIVTGRLDLAGAEAALDRIVGDAMRWPWWVRVAGGAVLAAMICLQAGGTVPGALLAAVILMMVNRVGWVLGRAGVPGFYTVAIESALVVVAGAPAFTAGMSGRAVAGMLAANLVLLLPILSVVSLAEDAIGGFTMMAPSRAVTVAMTLGALLAGVGVAGAVLLNRAGFEQAAYGVRFAPPAVVWTLVSSAVGAAGNTLFNGGAAWLIPFGVAAGVPAGAVNVTGPGALGRGPRRTRASSSTRTARRRRRAP
jgi:uncharacterized membrane protein YjjP (DUF1212 family)